MKNNQGYYHWIHSLNQASKQVQHNHAKLLYEAQYNPTISGESGLKQGKTRVKGTSRPGVVGSGVEQNAGDLATGIAGMLMKSNEGNPRPLRLGGETNIRNLANLGREIANQGGIGFGGEEFEDLGDEKGGPGAQITPEQLAIIAQIRREKEASIPYRTAEAEDSGINRKAHAERAAASARSLFDRSKDVDPQFKGSLAAKARIETGTGVAGDVELAAHDVSPTHVDLNNNGIVGDAGDVALDASDNSMDGQYAGISGIKKSSTPATFVPVAQTAAPESGVLRGRAAQIALAQKRGKRLSESVSDIINRMVNG